MSHSHFPSNVPSLSLSISRLERNYLSSIPRSRTLSAESVAPLSTSLPTIIIYPPSDEANSEPCISYAPNDYIVGLPNPKKDNKISILNATLQLFISLPHINEQLPATPKTKLVQEFLPIVKALHCKYAPLITTTNKGLDSANCSTYSSFYVTNVDPVPTGIYKATEDVVKLDWWLESVGLGTESLSQIFDRAFDILLSDLFGETRFGSNFIHEMINLSLKKIDSALDMSVVGMSSPTNNSDSPTSPSDGTCLSGNMITISLSEFSELESVNVVELINKTLGYANFFFGRPRSVLYSNPSSSPKKQLKFTCLPPFLILKFERPHSPTSGFHKTTVEMPEELDLGFYLAQGVTSAPSTKNSKSRVGKPIKIDTQTQNTFYRLHGFITQTEGHFLTYTRIRGGNKWFKCDDERVIDFDLSTRVSSKGVMVALYKLQC